MGACGEPTNNRKEGKCATPIACMRKIPVLYTLNMRPDSWNCGVFIWNDCMYVCMHVRLDSMCDV